MILTGLSKIGHIEHLYLNRANHWLRITPLLGGNCTKSTKSKGHFLFNLVYFSILLLLLIIVTGCSSSKSNSSVNNLYLDYDNLPETNFSCHSKVIGGYYADTETNCQMFHVCTHGLKEGEVQDIRFLCLNGTVFDQETRVCERIEEVDCLKNYEEFSDLNLELYNTSSSNQKRIEPELEDSADHEGDLDVHQINNLPDSNIIKNETKIHIAHPTISLQPNVHHQNHQNSSSSGEYDDYESYEDSNPLNYDPNNYYYDDYSVDHTPRTIIVSPDSADHKNQNQNQNQGDLLLLNDQKNHDELNNDGHHHHQNQELQDNEQDHIDKVTNYNIKKQLIHSNIDSRQKILH